ncbi:MAG TPA: hypothetical protein VLL48_11725, partial [Longimicrobiales bacterium]|nr:hypothetical protein [Longimicrobiales bacterium]
MGTVHHASVTRIADLAHRTFQREILPPGDWEAGDYVVANVLPYRGPAEGIELATGRELDPLPGDVLVGALARRYATLEAAGSYEAVEEDLVMHSLSEGGCFGRLTSKSRFSADLMPLEYVGHVIVEGRKLNMRDCVPSAPDLGFDLPVVLVVG